jgi:predicted amidohydrolase YtcJ
MMKFVRAVATRRTVLQGVGIAAAAAVMGASRTGAFAAVAAEAGPKPPITVFVARKIVTMDSSRPAAEAVAVRDGMILSVGSLAELQPWLKGQPYTIDRQFSEQVLLPGLIEPHMHPMLGAIGFEAFWITPESWSVMGLETPATTGPEAYIKALKAAFAARSQDEPIFMTWGYSQFQHGDLSRAILDTISDTQPIMVLQRSLHESYCNTPMMNTLRDKGMDFAKVAGNPQVDLDKGHFWEDGLFSVALPYMADYILDPVRVDKGYRRSRDYLNYNGVTTVSDMSTGSASWELEIAALRRNFDTPDSPVRVRLTPDVVKIGEAFKSEDEAFELVAGLEQQNTRNIFFNNGIKLFADGAMFSQAMQMLPPGYIDGHKGEWITQPDAFVKFARRYWNAGYQIHVHTNGNGGAKMVLDALQKIEGEKPRPDHRFTIEHYGFADDTTSRRAATLGAQVSGNPFYVYNLGDLYSEVGLGFDRAANITPLGGLARSGAAVALHSDFPMAPAEPLFLAWCAATRETMSGRVLAPSERLTLDQAIRAITIDAAYILQMEDQIGSIEAGKRADFAVLDKDPYAVGVDGLRKIKVWGTVFEGRPFKARAPA